ncbi:PREDICTED: uncharacterized protein LOC109350498 [Lupinus angustifolius]|uniref:uncharacterized protein LOC109350498 n=1 Tax=Lupinus angustifolius TaxID=3871 RepID=UPI00092FBEE5|nr:PREDICTED: uncharacterized protein LOC109350498 [Lupinus angustifolius]
MQNELNALEINKTWSLVDLPPNKRVIGCKWIYKIKYKSDGSIKKYKAIYLTDTRFLASKPVPTSIVITAKLCQNDSPPYNDPAYYRRLVGKLLYLTNSRPGISFEVQQLSQFMAQPTTNHHKALTRVLRYIKGNPGQGLFYLVSSSLQLKAFNDLDWTACVDSRKSISGCCVFLGNSLVSWKSKKHTTVVRSSSKAEYRALASSSCET